jgi:hypothetical protein
MPSIERYNAYFWDFAFDGVCHIVLRVTLAPKQEKRTRLGRGDNLVAQQQEVQG